MLKEKYKKNVDEMSTASLNADQKEIIKKIIDAAPENEVTQWYQLVIQKVKRGFRFDSAPETFQGAVSLLKENKNMNIKISSEKVEEDENLLIIGENYDALKNLLITHRNKVDVIYIDPPYNTESTYKDGNYFSDENIEAKKFIYRDKFSRTGWLNMLNERLKLAKDLLSEKGVIFVSIDDTEHAYLKVLMDDIFGEENFIANLNPLDNLKGKANDNFVSMTSHYIVTFAKNKTFLGSFEMVENQDVKLTDKYNKMDENGIPFAWMSYMKTGADKEREARKNMWFPILTKGKNIFSITHEEYNSLLLDNKEFNDKFALELEKQYKSEGFEVVWPISKGIKTRWTTNFDKFQHLLEEGRLSVSSTGSIQNKNLPSEKEIREWSTFGMLKNNFYHKEFSMGTRNLLDLGLSFSNPKSTALIEYLLRLISNKNILILDFFAGSGTTGHSVLNLNRQDGGKRKFILVTNNENKIGEEITYERIFRIVNGVGRKNQDHFKWTNKNKPFYETKLRVYDVQQYNVGLNDDISLLEEDAEHLFNQFNIPLPSIDDIYHLLNSLHPKKEEDN